MSRIIDKGSNRRMCAVCCDLPSTVQFQCDYPKPRRRSGSCDRVLCTRCTVVVGVDEHHCSTHSGPPRAAEQGRLF